MTGQLVRSVSSRLARNPVSKHKMEVVEEDIHITSAPPPTCAHKHTHTPHTHTECEDRERSGLRPGGLFLSRVHLGWDVSRAGSMQGVEDCSRGPQWERNSRGRGGVCTCLVSEEDDFGSSFMFPSALWESGDGEACMKHHGGMFGGVTQRSRCSRLFTVLDSVAHMSGHCTQLSRCASGCTEWRIRGGSRLFV